MGMTGHEISKVFIDATSTVHRQLGSGFLESSYIRIKEFSRSRLLKFKNDVHRAQTPTYLRLVGGKLGFLVNFNFKPVKDELKRVLNNLYSLRDLSVLCGLPKTYINK